MISIKFLELVLIVALLWLASRTLLPSGKGRGGGQTPGSKDRPRRSGNKRFDSQGKDISDADYEEIK